MWPGGQGYIQRHTLTHSLSLPAPVLPQHQEEGPLERPCNGAFLEVADPIQCAKQGESKDPADSLWSPQPWKCSVKPQAGWRVIYSSAWLGPWHSDRSAKRRTGFNLLLPAGLGL